MRKTSYFFSCLLVAFLCVVMFSTKAMANGQLSPKRLSSIGDSVTVGMNAELPLENPHASWANGYYGFWQWLFDLTNVNSHNQRISAEFGWWRRKNYMEAESGADSFDFISQAEQAVAHRATYVTVFLGNNDVCCDEGPLNPENFSANMYAGLSVLEEGLPLGATIYVVGLPDISQLWDAIETKEALGIVNCQTLWALNPLDLFPSNCRDLIYSDPGGMQSIIENYNGILQELVTAFNSAGSHYYFYTNTVFNNGILEEEVSDIDCYHPSAHGQSVLSEITWKDGPFSP